jgi:hypothetical protein
MKKPYTVEFLSNADNGKTKFSSPKPVKALEMTNRLEALIIEKSSQGYEFMSTQLHYEYEQFIGHQPSGYLVFFKEK